MLRRGPARTRQGGATANPYADLYADPPSTHPTTDPTDLGATVHDPMESVGRARDDLARRAGPFRTAGEALGPVSGQDRSGAVSVTVDGRGRITRIQVSMTWRQHLSTPGLAAAVNEAVTRAGELRMNDWGQALVEESDRTAGAPTPLPADDIAERLREASAADPNGGVETSMQGMRDMLRELVDSIDQVQQEVQAHLHREYAGRSPSGHARATVTGNGTLVDLSLDTSWLDQAHPNNVGREALQAVQDAYQRMAGSDVTAIIDRSPLAVAQRRPDDPLALARSLGLRY